MKIQQLKYFITLAESRSINDAAKRLYISQPSLTSAIQSLEKELGFTLFYRTKTGSSLTAAGAQILPEAKRMVETYNSWLALANQNMPKEVTIYSHISLSSFLIPNVMLQFKSTYSELPIHYEMTVWPERFYSMDIYKPTLALAICTEDRLYKKAVEKWGCEPIQLFEGEYGCLVHAKGELAGKPFFTPDDLKNYVFISPDLEGAEQMENGSIAAPHLQELFKLGAAKNIIQVHTVGNVVSLLERAHNAYVLSCSPAHLRYGGVRNGSLVHIPIRGIDTKVKVCLFYNESVRRCYPVVDELILAIQAACNAFLKTVEDTKQN